MAHIIGSVGRVRRTRVIGPGEANYVRMMNIQATGIADKIKAVAAQVQWATPQAIVYALKPIYNLSQEYVPVKTGKLKRSGFLEVDTESRSGVVRAMIGYARHGVPYYGAFVHEMVHIPHHRPSGARAKFLQAAVDEKIGEFKTRLVAKMAELSGLKD